MHSLSFLQVADMVSVVPNSKYHSLFFILRSERGHRGQTCFSLTCFSLKIPSPNFSLHTSSVLRAYSVIRFRCTEHILKLSSGSSYLTFPNLTAHDSSRPCDRRGQSSTDAPRALLWRDWYWQCCLLNTEPQNPPSMSAL